MDSAKYVFKTLDYLLKHKAKIVVRSVVTDYSVKFMPQAVNFFADRGVKYLRFETVNPWGRAEKLDIKPPSNRDYLRYFKKAFRISLKRKVSLISGSLLNFFTPSIHSCLTMSGEEMIVLPSGKVTGCYAVFNNDHPLSNPFIYGHYNNRKKEFVLDKCKKNILRNFNVENIKKCSACPLKYLCSGGCPLVHYTHTRLRNLYNVSKKWCELTKGIGSSIIEELFRYYYIKKNKKVAKDKNE